MEVRLQDASPAESGGASKAESGEEPEAGSVGASQTLARRAWSDPVLVGPCEVGDELIVNTEALDQGLGSGGFDVVLVNLTRGLSAEGNPDEHVMKLNYSPLQHPVETIEREVDEREGTGGGAEPDSLAPAVEDRAPVLAIGLHGHLAPASWAVAESAKRAGGSPPCIAYVQTGGGALPGALSRDVRELSDRGLIATHVTAGPAYGAPAEAITLVGALDAVTAGDFDGVIAGPGPGILGSATDYGHGGMAALDVLHAALALGAPSLLSPRLSAADPRPRHRNLSHHSRAVLGLLLAGVDVPLPETSDDLDLEAIEDLAVKLGDGRHRVTFERVDLGAYGESGLPRRSMGRDLEEDPDFFAAPLAAGARLGELIARAEA